MIQTIKSVCRRAPRLVLLLVTASLILAGAGKAYLATIAPKTNHRDTVSLTSWRSGQNQPAESPVVGAWPPTVDAIYPDLILTDQDGKRFQLSDVAGKVILLEAAAVPCAGCQAFAGGNLYGSFGGAPVQRGLESIHQCAKRYAGIDLGTNRDVVFVQLLLYGASMSSPTDAEVRGWARHFRMNRTANQIVLRGDRSMLGRESYAMIPGFHLIDRNFVLRYDSSGHHPRHDLYRELLPALGDMVRQSR